MKLKINRWEFDVTNNDWVLDNGSIYQCITLEHRGYVGGLRIYMPKTTIVSKKQFKQLVKEGKLIQFTRPMLENCYRDCKFWRFNLGDK